MLHFLSKLPFGCSYYTVKLEVEFSLRPFEVGTLIKELATLEEAANA